ncbi:MAG: hypothetical protein AB7Q17_12480 [Phycisphaerae bacterium]
MTRLGPENSRNATLACELLRDALALAAEGQFERLSTDRVAMLEAHLNTCRPCAARLAIARAPRDDGLHRVHAELGAALAPPRARWERMWTAIEHAVDEAERAPAPLLRLHPDRRWRPLAFAAACAIMVSAWSLSQAPAPATAWPLQLATHVEIDDMQVFDGGTTMLVSTGGEHDVAIIWVIDGANGGT